MSGSGTVVRCPEWEFYNYGMMSEANSLVAHVSNRHEQMPSSRTDHNCTARSYGLCANDAFAWCAALRDRTESSASAVSQWQRDILPTASPLTRY